jgi:hypothetical protein
VSASGAISANEAIALARQAIVSAERNLKTAAEFLAAAEEKGKTQRQMAEGVGKSPAWVNRLLQWRRDGYPEDTPFGAQSQERDERHDERVREETSEARSGPEQEPKQKRRTSPHSRSSQARHSRREGFSEQDRTTLVRVLGMLGSSNDNEALAAAHKAEALRQRFGLTWDDLIVAAAKQEGRKAGRHKQRSIIIHMRGTTNERTLLQSGHDTAQRPTRTSACS